MSDNQSLTVIENPTEQDLLHAFPVPADRPYCWRAVEPRSCDVICGGCGRVVAGKMTALDLWEAMSRAKDTLKLVWRCTCGAHLLVPAKGTHEPIYAADIISGRVRLPVAKRRHPGRPEPDLSRKR